VSAADRCTGTYDRIGRFGHDGDTCPIHESDPAVLRGVLRAARLNRRDRPTGRRRPER